MEKSEHFIHRFMSSFRNQEGLIDLIKMAEHPNGYRRENAVRRLGMLGDPVAIPMLIIRINDWVPQVRRAARDSLLKLLVPENAYAFSESLPDIFHLKYCGRDSHSEFISHIVNFLVHSENGHSLKIALMSEQPKVARIAAKLVLQHFPQDREEVVLTCLKHSDIFVRNISADYLRHLSAKSLSGALDIAIKDSFMPVRREAFQIYQRTDPENAIAMATEFLFDKHISIRELSITALQKTGVDVKGVYMKTMSSQNESTLRRRCSIFGLALLGAQEEVQKILTYLSDDAPSIRRSVLQAVEKLEGEKHKSLYVRLLGDASPSVAKESCRLISRLKLRFQSNEIAQIISLQSQPYTYELAIRAMRTSNKWERFIFLLQEINRVSTTEQWELQRLLVEISKWDVDFNRSSSQPTENQKEAIKREYAGCSNLLRLQGQESIEFTLRTLNVK